MDNEMIERVGRAMADYACVNYHHNQAVYTAYAVAAIKAMREPTANIIGCMDFVHDSDAIQVWQNVIDSITATGG